MPSAPTATLMSGGRGEDRVDYLDALDEVRALGFTLSGLFANVENNRLQIIEADAVFVRS